jgi:hypothetical protein
MTPQPPADATWITAAVAARRHGREPRSWGRLARRRRLGPVRRDPWGRLLLHAGRVAAYAAAREAAESRPLSASRGRHKARAAAIARALWRERPAPTPAPESPA